MFRGCWKDLLVFVFREKYFFFFFLGVNLVIYLILVAALVGI